MHSTRRGNSHTWGAFLSEDCRLYCRAATILQCSCTPFVQTLPRHGNLQSVGIGVGPLDVQGPVTAKSAVPSVSSRSDIWQIVKSAKDDHITFPKKIDLLAADTVTVQHSPHKAQICTKLTTGQPLSDWECIHCLLYLYCEGSAAATRQPAVSLFANSVRPWARDSRSREAS